MHGHEVLKTVPRGYDREHPRAELLKYKGITAWQDWPPAAWLSKPAAKDRVAEFMRTSAPLMSWLDTHVGREHGTEAGTMSMRAVVYREAGGPEVLRLVERDVPSRATARSGYGCTSPA